MVSVFSHRNATNDDDAHCSTGNCCCCDVILAAVVTNWYSIQRLRHSGGYMIDWRDNCVRMWMLGQSLG